MKNRKWLLVLLLGACIAVVASQGARIIKLLKYSQSAGTNPAETLIKYWTCSMHPQIHQDGPGQCPICHMTLVPVYNQPPAESPAQAGDPQTDPVGIRIDKDRQRQGGIRTAAVTRIPFEKILSTSGRAAVDVELSSAVREFVEIGRQDPALYRSAVTRLRLLGMGDEEIRALEHNPALAETIYRPATPGLAWVYATLYENELDLIHTGQAVIVSPSYAPEKELRGTVRSISPVVESSSRGVRARIMVSDPTGVLRPEAYVRVKIIASLGSQIVVPRSAMVYTGRRQLVFVATGEETFAPREVEAGQENGESVVIRRGLREGERIVTAGTFLIDSESRLQSALDNMEN